MQDQNNLIVYCEFEDGKVADVSLELLTKGRQLASQLGVKLEAVVIGDNLDGVENQLFPYGADVVYKVADKRLYPGIIRGTPQWSALYAKRVAVERSIGSFKAVLGLNHRKTFNTFTTKADLFLAGIVQLLCVVLADRLHDCKLTLSVRKLVV